MSGEIRERVPRLLIINSGTSGEFPMAEVIRRLPGAEIYQESASPAQLDLIVRFLKLSSAEREAFGKILDIDPKSNLRRLILKILVMRPRGVKLILDYVESHEKDLIPAPGQGIAL